MFSQTLPSFLLASAKTQHTFGKFCYQRSQNLCRRRRFRQLCALSGQVCVSVSQDCLISPHYHTCQVSPRGGSSVITLLPLFFWAWFCYQFRDFFLLAVVLLLFFRSLCTCSPSAGHDTQSIQSPPPRRDLAEEPESWEQPRSPHTVETCNSWICQRHHSLVPGEVPPGRSTSCQHGPPPFRPQQQQQSKKSTPTGSGRPTRVQSTRFNPFPFRGDTTRLPESASQQSVQPFLEVSQLRAQNSLFR